MAKPKLALIPATQGSKLYSVLPADGVGDFTFSRNSAATRINKDGLIEAVAVGKSRLNYPLIDGVVNGCPSHLLEPERLQLIQYSEAFDNAYWTKSGLLTPTSGFVSPKGDLSAFKLVEDSSNGGHKIHRNIAGTTANTNYSISFYVKANGNDYVTLNPTGLSASNAQFNINTKTIAIDNYAGTTYSNGLITELANGWLRCSVTINEPYGTIYAHIYTSSTPSYLTYTGNGTSGVYIFGAQLEQGSYPTSYIPNYGTSAGITRVAETANGAGDATTFNDSEGVLFAEISALADDSGVRSIAIIGSVTNDVVRFYYDGVSNSITAFVYNGAYQTVFTTTVNDITDNNKIAFSYKINQFKLYINGLQIGVTGTSGSIPNGLDRLNFDNGGGGEPFYGNTKQIQYFDSALNDSDLETITSWTSFTDLANGQQYSIK